MQRIRVAPLERLGHTMQTPVLVLCRMEATGRTTISFGDAGEEIEGGTGPWWLWYLPDAQDVRVHLVDRGGRILIDALHVEALANTSLGSSDLRPLQLSRLEAAINHPQAVELVRDVLTTKGPASHRPGRARGLRATSDRAGQERAAVHHELRYFGELAEERRAELREQARTRGRRPDEFYKQVAEEVARAAAVTRSPVAQVATDLDVAPSAVHRWLREARRRGLASPGREVRQREVLESFTRAVLDEEARR